MRLSLIAAGLLAAVNLTAAALQDIPPFDTYVSDPAGVLGPELVPTMEMMLGQVADSGGARIAVLSVSDLQGEPVGQYALRALYEWKAGDGATQSSLLLLAPDGVVVLATGGELLSRMSRAEAEAVLIETLLPTAAQTDMTTAVLSAAQSVMVGLMSEEGGPTGDPFAVVARFGADGRPELVAEDFGGDRPPMAMEAEGVAINFDPQQWINEMTAALSLALAAAGRDPLGFLAQAGAELDALPAVLDMVSSQPTVPEQVIVRFILLGLSVALCIFAWRVTRTVAVLFGVVGVLAGLWLWQISGFAALALCVMLAGALFLPALRVASVLIRGAATRDNGGGSGNAGPSQSYQDWLAAQRAKSAARGVVTSVATPAQKAATKVETRVQTRKVQRQQDQSGTRRLPGGMIDNRSTPPKAEAQASNGMLAQDRERLREAGIPTPAIDQLMRARVSLTGGKLNKGRIQMFIIGAAIAVVIFGPIAIFALIVLGVVWGRKLWAQVKPPHMSSGDFIKQIAKEAEAASKLKR